MFSMGLVVALGLLVMLASVSWRAKIWITSHHLLVNVAIFIVLFILHGGNGTFSGPMVATVGALFCHITIIGARKVIGYRANGQYVRGMWDISEKL